MLYVYCIFLQVLTLLFFMLFSCLALLFGVMIAFYWYHRRSGPCDYLGVLEYLSIRQSTRPTHCWADLLSYRQGDANWFDYVLCVMLFIQCAILFWMLRTACDAIGYTAHHFVFSSKLTVYSLFSYIVLVSLVNVCFYNFRSSIYNLDLRGNISLQLEESLTRSLNDTDLRATWDNTMENGCCCGVNSYEDFYKWNLAIPSSCQYQGEHPCDSIHTTFNNTIKADVEHPNATHPNATHPNATHPNATHPNATYAHGCLDGVMSKISNIEEQATHTFLLITGVSCLSEIILILLLRFCIIKQCKSTSRIDSSLYNVILLRAYIHGQT